MTIEFKLDPVSEHEWRIAVCGVPLTGQPLVDLFKLVPFLHTGLRRAFTQSDTCICSSKILVGVAHAMGVPAVVQSVRCDVYNPVMTRWFEAKDWSKPDDPSEGQRLKDAGGHVLVVGADDLTRAERKANRKKKPGAWNGHLVVVVAGNLLVDMTFDQFSRPERDVAIDDLFCGPWHPQRGTSATRPDGVSVWYQPRGSKEGRDYKTFPSWRRKYVISINGEGSSSRELRPATGDKLQAKSRS